MTLRSLKAQLSTFFFEPVSPYPVALFRIFFGLCVFATLLLLHHDWQAWFGPRGWITMETIQKAETGFRLNVFDWIPNDERTIGITFWVFLGASVFLTLGLWSRVSSVVVYLALNAMNQRMPLILHGGDTFLRVAGFFLIFSRSGAVLSLDSVLRHKRFPDEGGPARISPWSQRLIQYQVAVIYLTSFWWKVQGRSWREGTALFYVLNLREIQRFHVPGFFRMSGMIHLETWAGLAFELMFPLLIWFRPFRKGLLLAGLAFHLSLEYALNIPMFQWDMLSAYILFVEPEAVERFAGSVRDFLLPARRRIVGTQIGSASRELAK